MYYRTIGHWMKYSHLKPHGFTLIEAMVSLSVAMVAASAMFLGIARSLETTDWLLESAVAQGMAEQLVDEAIGKWYVLPGGNPYQVWLGPSSAEQTGAGRSQYNDTDDYHRFVAHPPEDRWGVALGREDDAGGLRHPNFRAPETSLSRYRQQVEVYYVDATNPAIRLPDGQTSSMRVIEVRVLVRDGQGRWQEAARVRRLFTYIPTA